MDPATKKLIVAYKHMLPRDQVTLITKKRQKWAFILEYALAG